MTAEMEAMIPALREWTSTCDALAAGESCLLIRKGGLGEGRSGFAVPHRLFALLPTLFHQTGQSPAHSVVRVACEVVSMRTVESSVSLDSLDGFHSYTSEQLHTRRRYKPEKPIHLIVVRPRLLAKPVHVDLALIKPVCRSWTMIPGEIGESTPTCDAGRIDQTSAAVARL